MKISRLIVFFLMVIAVNGLFSWLSNLPQDAGPDVPDGKISSFSFAPFREGQSPLTKVYPTTDQIDADLSLLASQTHTIRTYASLDGMEGVPALARKYGLKMIQGAWIGIDPKGNQAEVDQLIKSANENPDVIKRVIVGNEVLLRGELEPDQLLQYIRQVKRAIKQPVSYADVWSFYMRYPEIAKEVDYFTVHILPYWEDEPLKIEETTARIEENYWKIRKSYPGKPILIGESGWPSAGRQRGGAVPSVINEAKFVRELVQLSNKNGFDYNVVEAFNQPWKSQLEGVVGANWGVYSADRERVFPLTGKVTENSVWPKRLLYTSLLALVIISLHAKKTMQLSPLRLGTFLGFTQVLSALLVNQIGNYWYTSYNAIERLHVLFISGLSLLMAILIIKRILDLLRNSINERNGVWLRYLFLTFIAIALYKALSLTLNGRYLSIPYPVTVIPVIGILGYILIRYFVKGQTLTSALTFDDLFGSRTFSMEAVKTLSLVLGFTGLLLIIIEIAIVMQSSNYAAAYPSLTDRIYQVFMVTFNYSHLLGWPMLIGAIIIRIPLRTCACALAFMVIAVMLGETYAFSILHDFIESYPNLGARIGMGFFYTITNSQLILWLASLLILALPLWLHQTQKPFSQL
jgi:exo-beta-1,3-glucanase (GH17 family)